jgi:hypothetical protein
MNGEVPFEFYEIIFLVSQLRSLNRRISQCFINVPWPYITNLPSFFYHIYLPTITNISSILNKNPSSLSPIKSSLNSNYDYQNELSCDSLNSNSTDVNLLRNNIVTRRNIPSNNERTYWTPPIIGSCSEVCHKYLRFFF